MKRVLPSHPCCPAVDTSKRESLEQEGVSKLNYGSSRGKCDSVCRGPIDCTTGLKNSSSLTIGTHCLQAAEQPLVVPPRANHSSLNDRKNSPVEPPQQEQQCTINIAGSRRKTNQLFSLEKILCTREKNILDQLVTSQTPIEWRKLNRTKRGRNK